MLTAAAPGQTDAYLKLVAQQIHEDHEDRALREAAELAHRGPRYALSVLIDHVRKEES